MYTMKLSSLFTSTILKAKYISRWMREPRHIGFQRSQKRILIRYGYFSLCPTIVSAFLIHDLVERIQSGDVAKKVSSMKWKNFSWISQVIGSTSLISKQIAIYKIDTSIKVRKFKDWTVPCSRPASTFPNFSPYSSQRTTVGTLSSRRSSQGGPPEIEIQSSCKEGHFSTRVPSCRPECWEIRRKTPSKYQYSTTSWSSL